ncbi:short-chain dehydrogenase [Xylaria sp. CBS 124048]|nr:short-chain dehydrogenase [Xylaria sp. CBS 124048]
MAKYNKLVGKHVLVLGGTRGIGRGVIEASIESNARVTLVGSSQKTADAAVSAIRTEYPNASVVGLGCDLSQPTVEEDLDALFTRAAQISGELDHIVLTATEKLPMLKLEDIKHDDILNVAKLKLFVPIILGKVAKKHLAGATNGIPGIGKNKSLIMTTGTLSTKPFPNASLVSFFAAGIPGLVRSLVLDMAPIRVNAVEPGAVNTMLWDKMVGPENREAALEAMCGRLPTGKAGEAEEVAEAYMYLMRDSNATGEIVRSSGGLFLV